MSSKVIKLTWSEVAEMVRTELRKIIGKDVFCMAKSDDDTYWDISFPYPTCTVSLKLLMQRIVSAICRFHRRRIMPTASVHSV